LRGRDIKRYGYDWAGLYLIATHNGILDNGIQKVDVDKYPAIKQHLHSYWEHIKGRSDQGDTPYHLRSCAYMEDFSKPKLMWAETMRIRKDNDERFPRFAYTEQHFFTDKTCFVALGEDLKFLLAMLNSTLCRYQLSQTVAILDNGGYLMQKIYLEQIRVCKVESAVRSKIISHVTSLLGTMTAERRDFVENQLDLMVSSAFGLTDKEHKYLCTHTSQPLQRG